MKPNSTTNEGCSIRIELPGDSVQFRPFESIRVEFAIRLEAAFASRALCDVTLSANDKLFHKTRRRIALTPGDETRLAEDILTPKTSGLYRLAARVVRGETVLAQAEREVEIF